MNGDERMWILAVATGNRRSNKTNSCTATNCHAIVVVHLEIGIV